MTERATAIRGRIVRRVDPIQEKLGIELLRGEEITLDGEVYLVGNFLEHGDKVELWRQTTAGHTANPFNEEGVFVSESGTGPWTVYLETGSLAAGDKTLVRIHRPTKREARIVALAQQKLRGGYVAILKGGIEVESVGPEGASWLHHEPASAPEHARNSATVDATLLTDALGDDPQLASGIYVARAQDPAYGGLEALTVDGRAEYLGEHHDPFGTKMIAVAVPGEAAHAPNMGGAIRIGREFFTTALRDYHDWKEKWWREAIQNSVDAGATEIDCRVEAVPEGFAISVSDDGRGMDEDTLLNKFLVLGGTTKTRGDTRGGFGKAKELLVLPWLAWSIHTRDRKVVGAGLDYQVEPAPHRSGTEIRVVMPPDETTHESCALAFIEKCYLPGIRFTVNGERAKAKLAVGEELRSFEGKATLYYDKKGKTRGLFVRTMGLFMFEMWVTDAVKGTLIVELTGSSVELLTANRDGIRDYELKRGIEKYVNELAADVSSALKNKQKLIRKRFEGTGKFTGANERELRSAMLNHLEELTPAQQTKRGLVLSEEQRSVLQNVVHELGAGEGWARMPEEAVGTLNMRTNGETAAAMLDATVMPGPAAVEAAIKQLAWEPDFYLINEVEGFHVPKMFYPDGMTPGVKKLARAWAELCRFVLIQLGCGTPFGVGFIFSHDTAAAYQKEGDEGWLLLNPFRNAQWIGNEKPSKEALWGIVEENDVNELYASAIHECTHMADGVVYHDESFSSAFTRNVAKTANKDRQVRAIIKTIKARGPRGEARAPREKKAGGMAPLADSELETTRRERTLNSGYRYSMFSSTHGDRDSGADELTEYVLSRGEEHGYPSVEWRDQQAGGGAVWRAQDFNLPLAEKRGRKAAGLASLADSYLEGRRRESTINMGDSSKLHSLWVDYDRYSTSRGPLEELKDYATRNSLLAEVREPKKGLAVWRSADFNIDLALPEEPQRELPEIADEWMRSRRIEEALGRQGLGVNYVGFLGESRSVWDYGKDLAALIGVMEAEAKQDWEYGEIREVATGKPVWRSKGFNQPTLTPNRAFHGMDPGEPEQTPNRRRTRAEIAFDRAYRLSGADSLRAWDAEGAGEPADYVERLHRLAIERSLEAAALAPAAGPNFSFLAERATETADAHAEALKRMGRWMTQNRGFGGTHVSVADMDPDELELGIEYELGGATNDPAEAERIALDNLADDPHYYSRVASESSYGLHPNQDGSELPEEARIWNTMSGDERIEVARACGVAGASLHDPAPRGRMSALKQLRECHRYIRENSIGRQ